MLYQIGTQRELPLLPSGLPQAVITEILQGLIVLDAEYGVDRNYLESGGYSLLVETKEDILKLRDIINYEKHPCEWATRIGNTGYISALYILNDDFSIMVYLPLAIAPHAIILDLED